MNPHVAADTSESPASDKTQAAPQIVSINGGTNALHLRTPAQLKARVEELKTRDYLIDGLVPQQALCLLVGDSGLGKSPLLYQMALCVAHGLPFIGYEVQKPAKVLYIDCENSVLTADQGVTQLSRFLGLGAASEENVVLWNLNDAPDKWGLDGLIQKSEPSLVFIDPMLPLFPDLEESAKKTTEAYCKLRELMTRYRCTVIGLHHTRKPDSHGLQKLLEDMDVRTWLYETKGSRNIVTNADTRLGIDISSKGDLVLAGYERGGGVLPMIHIARIMDEHGEPFGYQRMEGVALLTNPDHRAAFEKLDSTFRFKDAEEAYRKGPSPTNFFLKTLVAGGLVVKVGRLYQKTEGKIRSPVAA